MQAAQFTSAQELTPSAPERSSESRRALPGPLWEGEREEDFDPAPAPQAKPDVQELETLETLEALEEETPLLPMHRVAPSTVAFAALAVLFAIVLGARALLGGATPKTPNVAAAPPPEVAPAAVAAPVLAVPVTTLHAAASAAASPEPRPAAAPKPKRPTQSPSGRR